MIPAAHVIFVLDDSGSMGCSEKITKKSFDGFVEALQLCKGADIVMSLIKFGERPRLEYARTHIQEVAPVVYKPRNGDDTIYDSLLYAIRLAEKAPREEKSIIILQADGGDTCSSHRPPEVRAAVLAAKARGMEFLFLGAAPNGEGIKGYPGGGTKYGIYHCAEILGFEPDQVLLYNSGTGEQSAIAFAETAANIGSVASRQRDHADYTKEQQERVTKK